MIDLPNLYKDNSEVVRMMLMFTNQLNQIYNMVFADVGHDLSQGKRYEAMAGLSSVMISSIFIYMASHGGFPDDEEEWGEAFFEATLGSFVASLPILGPAGMSLARGYSPALSPLTSILKQGGTAINQIGNEEYGKATINALQFSAILGGRQLPLTQLKRTVAGMLRLAEGETEDYRELLWSEKSLK